MRAKRFEVQIRSTQWTLRTSCPAARRRATPGGSAFRAALDAISRSPRQNSRVRDSGKSRRTIAVSRASFKFWPAGRRRCKPCPSMRITRGYVRACVRVRARKRAAIFCTTTAHLGLWHRRPRAAWTDEGLLQIHGRLSLHAEKGVTWTAREGATSAVVAVDGACGAQREG